MGLLQNVIRSKTFERVRRQLALRSGIYCRIKKLSASSSEHLRTVMLLEHFKIDLVIDVGANTGQFAESLIDFGFRGRIISFEPVKVCHDQLLERSRRHANWVVPERMAIGSSNGEITIHVSEDTVFSSILGIKESYAKKVPRARSIASEQVPIARLDDVTRPHIRRGDRILLKVDTQGFEKEVIEGAPELLGKITGLKIEIPLHPIYENTSWTFNEIFDLARNNGFQPWSITPEGVDLRTGRMNTIDGLFFRREHQDVSAD